MTFFKAMAMMGALTVLAACEGGPVGPEKTRDGGIDGKHLSQLVAGIWTDPNGCDHWIVDDGVEGYLSPRLQPDGAPVCSNAAPPGVATGPFREGTIIPDWL
jgi:hypothetical protein